MASHPLRCQGIAVGDYNFTLGRLEAGAPSTFAQSGCNFAAVANIRRCCELHSTNVLARQKLLRVGADHPADFFCVESQHLQLLQMM